MDKLSEEQQTALTKTATDGLRAKLVKAMTRKKYSP